MILYIILGIILVINIITFILACLSWNKKTRENFQIDLPFYIYDDPKITMNGLFDDYGGEIGTLVKLWKKHPSRVLDPSKAKLFIVPTNILASFDNDKANNYKNHIKRIDTAMNALLNNKWFKRNNGADHFLDWHEWPYKYAGGGEFKHLLPKKWLPYLEEVFLSPYKYLGMSKWKNDYKKNPKLREYRKNMYIDKDGKYKLSEKSKNIVHKPFQLGWNYTNYGKTFKIIIPTYENWVNRPYLIYHVTHNSTNPTGVKIRQLPMKNKKYFPDCLISTNLPKKEWEESWGKGKFAFVMTGDDPCTHQFTHAIAGGCIPIIVSDLFELICIPFKKYIDLKSFTISIPEDKFLKSPEKVVPMLKSLSENTIKSKLKALREVQPKLLYNHPNTIVHELVLDEIKRGGTN